MVADVAAIAVAVVVLVVVVVVVADVVVVDDEVLVVELEDDGVELLKPKECIRRENSLEARSTTPPDVLTLIFLYFLLIFFLQNP